MWVFPNPASGVLNVAVDSAQGKPVLLRIVNGQGTVVLERRLEALPAEPLQLDLSGLKSGIYWLDTQVEGRRSQAVKLVVARE